MEIAERSCLVSDIELDGGKFNIIEYETKKIIDSLRNLSVDNYEVFEIRVRAFPKGFFEVKE